ncbi:MAG: outer membrane protein transport protein [Candidatus Omnitrophica bacterium]|nr:outer membrane protein transport protein [Candidatus Omnitrophota bacterium]
MKKIIVIFSLGLALIFPARNAYCVGSGAFRLEAPDAEALGKGLAFVAQADNPSAVYFNPAGLTQLKGKTYLSLGAAAIQPFCTYKDESGNKTERRKQVFTIPNFYVVSDFGLEKFSFGLGGSSYWGLGTYWSEDSFSKYVSTKSDYRTEDIMFAGAYEINDNLSIGLAADYTKSYVNKKKLINQGAWLGADGDFQLKAKDNSSWGYRLSTLYKLNKKHSFGFMYRSPVDVKYKGKLYLDGLNGVYAGAAYFGGSSYETEITSKTTLPQSIVLGYCYKPNEKLKFEFDTEWMDWSSIQEEKIDYPSESNANRLSVLNGGNPAPKDWHSAFAFGLGAEYKVNGILKLRAGYLFHKTPIPQANFDTSLPNASSNTLTLGAGINLNKNTSLDFAYAGMLYNKRKINNSVGSLSSANINGEYATFINIYLLTFTLKL